MAEQQFSPKPLNKWLKVISPCVIGIAICIFSIVVSALDFQESGGWSFIGVIIFLPVLFVLLALDFVVKQIFKRGALYVWLTELALIALGIFIFFTCFYT